jgi:hypothetical protein
MERSQAATEYRKSRTAYKLAARISCAGEATDQAFLRLVRDALPDLEVVTIYRGKEYVSEREATPEEWVNAAHWVVGEFCDRYTVRNALWPSGDWEWEQTEIRAGRIR